MIGLYCLRRKRNIVRRRLYVANMTSRPSCTAQFLSIFLCLLYLFILARPTLAFCPGSKPASSLRLMRDGFLYVRVFIYHVLVLFCFYDLPRGCILKRKGTFRACSLLNDLALQALEVREVVLPKS